MKSQADWVCRDEVAAAGCHQMGTKATREIPKSLGTFDSPRRPGSGALQSGQIGGNMARRSRALAAAARCAMYADWTDRIAAGEVPQAPPRPQGVERNVVISMWDWQHRRGYVHDAIATDKRNPTINANGPVYSISRISAPET